LKFALETALPKRMEPAALREWLVRKRDSQEKLSGYLEEAAIFLGTPGNTMPKFLEQKRANAGRGGQTTASDESSGGSTGIMGMSADQIQSLNPADLSDQELKQAADRYNQLGGQ